MADRLEAAFAEEERLGSMRAGQVRALGVTAILVWHAIQCPCDGVALAYELGIILVFLMSGLAHLILVWRRRAGLRLAMAFMALDCAFLGFVMVTPNPFMALALDPAAYINNAYIVAFYLLLMQAAFSYAAPLLLFTGGAVLATWTGVLIYGLSLPGARSEFSIPGDLDLDALLTHYHTPGFIYVGEWIVQLMVTAIIVVGLSLVVVRARAMAMSRARSERGRANLARYFPPAIVDLLAERESDIGAMRRQEVAVLFVDIRGFTGLSERLAPERVMQLLRTFHAHMEAAIFAHGGMMEKYIGDAMLATFGAPSRGPRDAADALACARAMVTAMAGWNRARIAAGETPLAVGIGVHYGPAVQGDIGTARSMAFAVIGDTVNTAARIQALAGREDWPVLVSDALVRRVEHELGEDAAAVLDGLADLGPHQLSGRDQPLTLWGVAGGARAEADDGGLATPSGRAQGLAAGRRAGRSGEREAG